MFRAFRRMGLKFWFRELAPRKSRGTNNEFRRIGGSSTIRVHGQEGRQAALEHGPKGTCKHNFARPGPSPCPPCPPDPAAICVKLNWMGERNERAHRWPGIGLIRTSHWIHFYHPPWIVHPESRSSRVPPRFPWVCEFWNWISSWNNYLWTGDDHPLPSDFILETWNAIVKRIANFW